MKAVKNPKRDFYIYLKKNYAGKLVAYSIKTQEILAVGKTAISLEKQLKKKKVNFAEVVFTGPVPEPGRIYVYLISILAKAN